MLGNIDRLIFNLDGVLFQADTIALEALSTALERTSAKFEVDLTQPSPEQILSILGIPAEDFIKELNLSLEGEALEFFKGEMEDEELRLIEDGRAHLFGGVPEVLSGLKNDGFGLSVVSDSSRRYLMAVCDHFDLCDCFDFALCIEEIPRREKEGLLREILEKTGSLAQESIYIADRRSDLEAARKVQCGFIACLWGYGKEAFQPAVPTASSVRELARMLSRVRVSDMDS